MGDSNKTERFSMRLGEDLKEDFSDAVKPEKMSKVVHNFMEDVVAKHKAKKEQTSDGDT